MNEVSCQVLDVFFQQLRREKRPPSVLAVGLPVPVEHLLRRQNRIDWAVFVQFMRNAGAIWTPQELSAVGEAFFLSRGMRAMSLIARLLFDAPGFYRWVFEKQTGAGDQSFGGVFEHSHQQLDATHLRLELKLKEGWEPCPEFYPVTAGNFRGMPRALGLGPADVKMSLLPSGARFDVTVPLGGGWVPKIKRAVLLPFSAHAVAGELKESLESLQARYAELSEARTVLAAQSERLQVVNRLGRELAQHTRLSGLASAMSGVLREALPELGMTVYVNDETGARENLLCQIGSETGVLRGTRILLSGDETVGRLEVRSPTTPPPGQMVLLDDLVPWISIAVGNARSFTLLGEYRDQLSLKVDQRTTELNAAMQELQGSLSREREALRLKTEFFDNVSHELRTPLTLILLTLESLQAHTLPPSSAQHLDRMQRSANRLLRLINDLLDLAKVEAGKMRLRYSQVALVPFLEAVLIPFRVLAEKKGLQLQLDAAQVEDIHADPDKLDAVFQNLIANALKFTSHGEVTVRVRQDAFFVHVEVADTGMGIDAADLPKLFQRFAQADSEGTRRLGGTGIGLALARETVELHEGTVDVTSVSGKGSVFKVSLPRGTAHVKESLRDRRSEDVPVVAERRMREPLLPPRATPPFRLPAPSARPPLPQQQQPLADGAPTVLVVEDDPEIREYLCLLLQPHYQVLQAPNGAEGLELARAGRPALIISDVMMPVMSGLTLLQQLHQNGDTAEIPVILLTARHELDARVEGLQVGASDYISKPFSPRELLARVDTQLRLRDATARIAQTERLAATSLITSGFAHEVRNPLNGLINALAPLRESMSERPDPELALAMLEVVDESVHRIRHLAESLLAMVRTDPGWVAFDVGATLQAAQRTLSWKLPPTVSIAHEHLAQEPVSGEPGSLTQVWINLIDNALRALGDKGTIRVSSRSEGEEVVVRICDDGCGMAPETLKRAFEPFYTTRLSGDGTGLGLALCRRIVVQHRGQIGIESTLGGGTTVTVRLPAHRPQLPAERPKHKGQGASA